MLRRKENHSALVVSIHQKNWTLIYRHRSTHQRVHSSRRTSFVQPDTVVSISAISPTQLFPQEDEYVVGPVGAALVETSAVVAQGQRVLEEAGEIGDEDLFCPGLWRTRT